MHLSSAAISGQLARRSAVALGLGYPGRELIDDMAQTMRLFLLSNLVRDAAGIQHVLMPIEHFRHRGRLRPGWIPHVDREDQRVSAGNVVEYRLGRGVREDPAVPIQLAVDTNSWECRPQRARCHHVLDPKVAMTAVLISRIS